MHDAEATAEWQQIHESSQDGPARLVELMDRHRERLRRMVTLRLDTRVQSRVDASDVIQEAYIEACDRIQEYLSDPAVPFFVWLRFLTMQRLSLLHRKHLGVKARNAARDISIYQGALPAATSAAIAAQLLGQLTSPSNAALRAEASLQLQQALNDMNEIDREVLLLRHFEQLSQKETAQVLGIGEKAAGARHLRALTRLKKVLNIEPLPNAAQPDTNLGASGGQNTKQPVDSLESHSNRAEQE